MTNELAAALASWTEYELRLAAQEEIKEPLDPTMLRGFWRATSNIVEACDIAQTPLPAALVGFLRIHFDTLAAGKMAPGLTKTLSLCAQHTPAQREAVGLAVGYIKLVREGYIKGVPNPVGTISRMYGATKRRVQEWPHEYDAIIPDCSYEELLELLEKGAKMYGKL